MSIEFLVFLIGVLGALINSEVTSFECHGVTYIRPNNSLMSWSDAQGVCRSWNATLPIVSDTHCQSGFVSALMHFNLSDAYVWLGANSSGGVSSEWRWVNGREYNGTDISTDSYQASYAYVNGSINAQWYSIQASKSTMKFPYICRYKDSSAYGKNSLAHSGEQSCFIKYEENVTWFQARNRCLQNNGDLISLNDLSIFGEIVDHEYWIGLQKIWWNWTDIVTGWTMDVTYTHWSDGQPDGKYSQCISTNGTDNTNWIDRDCTNATYFICQVSSTSLEDNTNEPVIDSMSHQGATGSGRIALGVGLGVGIGVPFILAVIVVIALVCRRHRKGQRKSKLNGRAEKNGDNTDMNDSSGNYVTVSKKHKDPPPSFEPSDSTVNYIELEFNNTADKIS